MRLFLLIYVFVLASCGTVQAPSVPATDITFSDGTRDPALSWEVGHSERKAWSDAVFKYVDESFVVLDKASDMPLFCPRYEALDRSQRVNVWAELFVAIAKFESAWKPAAASVDVGEASDKDTWSVGLLQMSVVDQVNYGQGLGYKYADLLTPGPNLNLGIDIMALQIQQQGTVLIPVGKDGLYWAVLHPGGKFDQTKNIELMVQKLTFCKTL